MKISSFSKLIIIAIAALFTVTSINAQDLNETLQKLSGDAAKAYLAPVTNGFGANLNTGWATRSPKAKIWGVDIQFGLVAMGAFMGDNSKTFNAQGTFRFSRAQAEQIASDVPSNVREQVVQDIMSKDQTINFSGPTAVGSKNDKIKISFPGGTYNYNGTEYNGLSDVELPVGGLLDNLSVIPLTAPQLTLGTVYGTQLSFRFLPDIQLNEEIGKLSYFGFGIQHNIGMWLPAPLPVDVSVGFFTQNLKVGDLLESSATEFGAYASRTFGPGALNVTPYAGFSYQSSSLNASYDYVVTNGNISTPLHVSFDSEGENTVKFTVGTAFKLGFLNLNVDYNIAKYSTVGAGLGFIF